MAFPIKVRREVGYQLHSIQFGIEPTDWKFFSEAGAGVNEIRKEQLMEEIAVWISDKNMKQADVATVLHISRPRESDVVNKKTNKFTIDVLVNMLSHIGKPVRVSVG